ncbi:MAG: tripartite tricarboxylate transporter permease, partial [Spirochaetaceae bacterium]|nr:tripartite tricarboxylate transporter permease [Spirochaetaceae bacterium]
ITIGPMISEIFTVFAPKLQNELGRDKPNEIWLAPDVKTKGIIPNPFKMVSPKQATQAAVFSSIGACTFTFSPVGMTVMLGEIVAGRCKELYQKITGAICVQDGVSNSTYLGEFIIPLIAFAGMPITAVAAGPGASLFNAPPRFSVEPLNNLAQLLTIPDYIIFGIIGVIGGALFAFPIAVKKARSWTEFMFRKISHEALIGAFLGLIFMLAFYEAGLLGIIIALAIGIFGGYLHNRFGIHTGVQFMAYYASSWLVVQILAVAKILV